MLARSQQLHGIFVVREVGRRDIHRVHIRAGGQVVHAGKIALRAPFLRKGFGVLLVSGADGLQRKACAVPAGLQQIFRDKVGANCRKAYHLIPS